MVSSSMRSDKTAVSDDEYPDSARQLPTTPPGHDSYRPPSSLRSDVCGVTFSGDPDENVAEFIRRVQQAPLVQADSSNKDQKIAEYAMGCLTDEALIWACELEEDIQQSWTQLRRELVRRFAPDQSRGPSTAGSPRSSRSSRPTAPEPPVGREGIIELVDYEDGRVVGKLSIGPGDTAVCTTLPKDEMRIEIPASPTDTFEIKELWHLSHPITLELSNQSDDNYENTELDELPLGPASMSAVDSTRNRASNNSTPDQLIRRTPSGTGNRPLILNGRIASSFHIWPAPPHHPFLGVALVTSNRAGSNVPSSRLLGGPPAAQPTATKWVFKHCASSRIGDRIYRRRSDVLRSPGATGSARIWKISTADEDGIEELSIFWMENDLSLSELGVYRQGNGNITLHRLADDTLMAQGSGATPAPSLRRLRMIFRQVDSPGPPSLPPGRSFSSPRPVSQSSARNFGPRGGHRRTFEPPTSPTQSTLGVLNVFATIFGSQGTR